MVIDGPPVGDGTVGAPLSEVVAGSGVGVGYLTRGVLSIHRFTWISAEAKDDPHISLEQLHMFGEHRENERFAAAFETWLRMIWAEGTEATLASYCDVHG